jgi:hypothetical protein
LDEVHPAPALQTCSSMELVEAIIYNVPCGKYSNFRGLKEGEPQLLFPSGIPCAYEVRQTRVDAGHGNAQENANDDQLAPSLDECRA